MATQLASDDVLVTVTASATQTAFDDVLVTVNPAGVGTQFASDIVQVVVTNLNVKSFRWDGTALQPVAGRWGVWNGTGFDWLTPGTTSGPVGVAGYNLDGYNTDGYNA